MKRRCVSSDLSQPNMSRSVTFLRRRSDNVVYFRCEGAEKLILLEMFWLFHNAPVSRDLSLKLRRGFLSSAQ